MKGLVPLCATTPRDLRTARTRWTSIVLPASSLRLTTAASVEPEPLRRPQRV